MCVHIQSIAVIGGSYVFKVINLQTLNELCGHWLSKYWTVAPTGIMGLSSSDSLVCQPVST